MEESCPLSCVQDSRIQTSCSTKKSSRINNFSLDIIVLGHRRKISFEFQFGLKFQFRSFGFFSLCCHKKDRAIKLLKSKLHFQFCQHGWNSKPCLRQVFSFYSHCAFGLSAAFSVVVNTQVNSIECYKGRLGSCELSWQVPYDDSIIQ